MKTVCHIGRPGSLQMTLCTTTLPFVPFPADDESELCAVCEDWARHIFRSLDDFKRDQRHRVERLSVSDPSNGKRWRFR